MARSNRARPLDRGPVWPLTMSIFDDPDTVPASGSWRCTHCRTLQPETSRCRTCQRSAFTCSTCHLYGASVASDLGFCASDRVRTPLTGDEVRACWQATGSPASSPGLFAELEPRSVSPTLRPMIDPAPAPKVKPAPRSQAEEPRQAGWVETAPAGGLVEAPHVAPGREVLSEVQRRLRKADGR
jgi:hypothetical protein